MELIEETNFIWGFAEFFHASVKYLNKHQQRRKMMLSTIINNIRAHSDRIEVDFKLHISQFIGVMGVVAMINVDTGRVLSHSAHAASR